MTTTAHPQPLSFDDIVFEGRNKAYGAYVLRRIYGRHLYTAVLLATALLALLIAIPVLIQTIWPSAQVAADLLELPKPVLTMTDVVIPKQEVLSPPAAHQAVVVRPPAASIPTRVVPNDQVKPVEEPVEPITSVDGPGIVGPVASDGPAVGPIGDTHTGNDTAANTTVPATMKPFVHVEEMPDFVGGQAALAKYLQRHLRYPASALREGVSGKVFVAFTVNSDGSIVDVEILKGLGYGTDEEASRVISSMPAWKPGRQNKHAVPVRYTLPITFRYE